MSNGDGVDVYNLQWTPFFYVMSLLYFRSLILVSTFTMSKAPLYTTNTCSVSVALTRSNSSMIYDVTLARKCLSVSLVMIGGRARLLEEADDGLEPDILN